MRDSYVKTRIIRYYSLTDGTYGNKIEYYAIRFQLVSISSIYHRKTFNINYGRSIIKRTIDYYVILFMGHLNRGANNEKSRIKQVSSD